MSINSALMTLDALAKELEEHGGTDELRLAAILYTALGATIEGRLATLVGVISDYNVESLGRMMREKAVSEGGMDE